MAKAKLVKQLNIETANKVGMFAEVSEAVTDAGVNIIAICAYAMDNKATFMIITNDNNKVKAVLAKKGFKVEEVDVVTVMLPDKVGEAKNIADKIKKSGINLDYLYGTTCGCVDSEAIMVIGSKDNVKVISAINA